MSWLLATGLERRSPLSDGLERLIWLLPGLLFTLYLWHASLVAPLPWVTSFLLIAAGLLIHRWLRSTGTRTGLGFTALAAITLVALWINRPNGAWSPFGHLLNAILFVLPVPLLTRDLIEAIGLASLRKAQTAIHKLVTRRDWPLNPLDCRHLPEVRLLREAIYLDPTPALSLLSDPRITVKLSGLIALEHRPTWMPGQADYIAYLLSTAEDPLIRSGCLRALAPITDPAISGLMINFLRDPAKDVRSAAIESLLYRPEKRWHQIRVALHDFLNDPRYAGDGALNWTGGLLPTSAINDLMSWAAETGTASLRATLTLVAYYHRAINETGSSGLVTQLVEQMRNPRLPAMFRVELAHLLQKYQCLDAKMLEAMLYPSEPSAIRLVASEALLMESGGKHPEAITALREIARQPNREMAITAAVIVQKCLKLDMGLPWGNDLPKLQSKQAAEVTRRVMAWAVGEGSGVTPPPSSSITSTGDESMPPPAESPVPPPTTDSKPTGWEW